MNQFEIFEHANFGKVRVIIKKDEPWFVAKEICDILDLDDVHKVMDRLDDDEKLTGKVFRSGQNRAVWMVNESGLYNLIFRSYKPEAKMFRKWVTSEVLPAIRKTGSYNLDMHKKDILRGLTRKWANLQSQIVSDMVIGNGITKYQERAIKADEADMLNIIVFGRTAKEWRDAHPELAVKNKNMRDYANEDELFVLTFTEALNAGWIWAGIPREIRFQQLNDFARSYLCTIEMWNKYPHLDPHKRNEYLEEEYTDGQEEDYYERGEEIE